MLCIVLLEPILDVAVVAFPGTPASGKHSFSFTFLRMPVSLINLQVSSRKFLLDSERLVPAIDMLNHRGDPNTEYGRNKCGAQRRVHVFILQSNAHIQSRHERQREHEGK